MAEYTQQKVVRGGGGSERRRFLRIVRKVSAAIGTEYFRALVKQVGQALEADCVYIGEFVGGQSERVRTVAARLDQERMESLEFPLAGSPDAEVAIGNPCIYSAGLQELFPSDRRLKELDAEACVGIPLNDSDGQAIGLIIALYRQPLGDEVQFVQSMLSMFAPRASAELNRKQADDAVRESEQRHQAFIMLNADAMWRLELEKPIAIDLPEKEQLASILRDGYVAECNDALAHLVGLERAEQLIGATVGEVFPPQPEESIQHTNDSLLAFVRSGYQFGTVETTPVDHAGNQRYFLRSQWGIVENRMLQRIWGTSRDITDLRHYEKALATSERRLTDLLEALQLVAIVLDRQEAISFCNNFLLKLTGWQAEEVIGKNWFDLMVPPAEREKLRAALSSGPSTSRPAHFEATLLGRDGHRRPIEWDSVILHDSKGEIAGSAWVGRDITEHKALEAQFRQSQKLESIGRLAGGVAHDFNNLLTIVRGYGALLLEQRDRTDPAYTGLVEIVRAAEKGAALTNQLLTFSRRQIPQPRLLDLNALIAEHESMLRRILGEDIELTTDLDPLLGFVYADAGHIHQVIMNLAVNARDAMPHGGKLIFASSNVDLDEHRASRLSGIEPGPYVQLIIADTGVGMSDEVRAHLFEPFFTTKEINKGTGLGLSTVYGIVSQSGGHIMVETEPEKGTTFEIFLPRVPPPVATETVESAATPATRGGTETILLVEDQPAVRALLVTLLRQWGYTVLDADSGRQALRFIDQLQVPIHLVVTDVVMPGMSGVELAEQLKAKRPGTKVLYISGYSGTAHNQQIVNDPTAAYLQKPFPPAAFVTTVREVLDRQ